MIKNVIFDIGNVIIQGPTIKTVKEFFKSDKDANIFYDYIFIKSKFWEMLDLGEITNLEVANIIKEKRLVEVSDYDEVRNFMLDFTSKCNANNKTIEIVKKLKQIGYNIYMLSNMQKVTFESLSNRYDVFDIVDGAIISAYEGIKKPNPDIFKLLLERYSLNAEECLLIDDDDTNKTLEVANSKGIKGRRVNANDTDDVIKLLKENDIVL